MHRLFDWQCSSCGTVTEQIVVFPQGARAPSVIVAPCEVCETDEPHDRLLSTPARYMGDRPRNPCVTGGGFDTMGYSPVQSLPDLPPDADSTLDNYKALWSTTDWKEKRALQREQNRKNREKRKRAAALASGATVNMRVDKCAGDPKMEG